MRGVLGFPPIGSGIPRFYLIGGIMIYDMNIWDEGGYLSDYEASPQFKINFYTITHDGAGYGTGPMIDEYDYYLNWNEVQMLGVENEEDFWIDTEHFVWQTELMPRKLRRHLEKIGVEFA